jgi:hypothetical protein
MIILPLMMTEEKDTCFEYVHEINQNALAFKRRLYRNPKVQKIIKNCLPTFDAFGILDEM